MVFMKLTVFYHDGMAILRVEYIDHICRITLPTKMKESDVEELIEMVCRENSRQKWVFLFDAHEVQELPETFVKQLRKSQVQYQFDYFTIRVPGHLNLSEKLLQDLKIINNSSEVHDRLPKESYANKKETIVKQFIDSSRFAVSQLFDTNLSADENYSLDASIFDYDLYDWLSEIKSADRQGELAFVRLYFQGRGLLALTRALSGLEENAIDMELMQSTASEFLNIVYSHSRSQLRNRYDIKLEYEFPVVQKSSESTLRDGPKSLFPLATPYSMVYLEFTWLRNIHIETEKIKISS